MSTGFPWPLGNGTLLISSYLSKKSIVIFSRKISGAKNHGVPATFISFISCLSLSNLSFVASPKSIIFSCAEQDQNFKTVNFDVLKNRLSQNSFLEKLDQLYLDF